MANEITNKLTIVLNDKNMIAELLKDKDVCVKISDAVIDGIARRTLKLNGMTETIINAAHNQIKSEFLSGNSWQPTLKPQFQSLINQQVKQFMENEVYKQFVSTREEAKNEIQKAIQDAINPGSLKKMIQYAIEQEVKRMFKS